LGGLHVGVSLVVKNPSSSSFLLHDDAMTLEFAGLASGVLGHVGPDAAFLFVLGDVASVSLDADKRVSVFALARFDVGVAFADLSLPVTARGVVLLVEGDLGKSEGNRLMDMSLAGLGALLTFGRLFGVRKEQLVVHVVVFLGNQVEAVASASFFLRSVVSSHGGSVFGLPRRCLDTVLVGLDEVRCVHLFVVLLLKFPFSNFAFPFGDINGVNTLLSVDLLLEFGQSAFLSSGLFCHPVGVSHFHVVDLILETLAFLGVSVFHVSNHFTSVGDLGHNLTGEGVVMG
jgi:hypothetical protein